MFNGCFTALITPFTSGELDYNGLKKLIEFQIQNKVSGILAVGTTGESPTLKWEEHFEIIKLTCEMTKNNCLSIAGTGSNNTRETLEATKHAINVGADAALLIDPYYNGPSSLEIRKEYVEPVAEIKSDFTIIPYVIPGRTGTQLLPEDIAILYKNHPNVKAVKEATGNIENMKKTRSLCGADFEILSGDDDKTYEMMTNPSIKASGVISVVSNVFPKALQDLTHLIESKQLEEANELLEVLKPLFVIVGIITKEDTPFGQISHRARNPVGVKTLMSILGMPSGQLRPPMGKITKKGFDIVLNAAKNAFAKKPEIFNPIAEFFNIDIENRLNDENSWSELYYNEY